MDATKETMSRLKMIGSLKKGEKINTKNISVQPDTFVTSLSRKFYIQDNRTNMISFVEKTINRAVEIIDRYKKSEDRTDKILLRRLLDDLTSCMMGLERLKETYISDNKIVADLETFTQIIDAKLSIYDDNYQEKKKN